MFFYFLSGSFYNLPSVSDFIIDILLGSPSAEVHNIDLLYNLNLPSHYNVVWSFRSLSSLCLPDPPCSLRSAVHPEPVWHLSLSRCPETQPVPPLSHPHRSASTMESYVGNERDQPEVIRQEALQLHVTETEAVIPCWHCFLCSGSCLSALSTLTSDVSFWMTSQVSWWIPFLLSYSILLNNTFNRV